VVSQVESVISYKRWFCWTCDRESIHTRGHDII